MARSRKNLKRKRSSGSKDSGHYSKHHASNTHSSNEYSPSTSSEIIQQPSFHSVVTYSQIPYHSWLVYFYDQAYIENSPTVLKINAIATFFLNNSTIKYDPQGGFDLNINFCINHPFLREKWPNFVEDLKANPEHTLKYMKAALFELMMQRVMRETPGNAKEQFKILRLNRINILNYESVNPISSITWSSIGRLVSISGIVVSAGQEKFSLDSVVLVCECNYQVLFKPRNDRILVPKKCDVCGNARMKRAFGSPFEMTGVSQSVDVKLRSESEQQQSIQKNSVFSNIMSVRLTQSLVNQFMPGDNIRIIGIPRVTLGAAKAKSSESNPLYINAESVFLENNDASGDLDPRINSRIIQEIEREPDIMSLLVHSLCPSVQGHELIKAALVLGLFGGTFENSEMRDNIHVYIIGNLGLGKSQLLRCCAQVAPKGTYIRGSSTVSLDSKIKIVQENGKEDCRFEAGSLVLSNSGLLCLDDFDTIVNQHQMIYNAMKNRRVETMNPKFNFSRTFSSSIFAMTNSTKKHYDPSKTLVENVNTSKQLLKQFDLIFLMRDNPDWCLDKLLCTRVLREHKKTRSPLNQLETTFESRTRTDLTLRERLVNSNRYEPTYLLPERIMRMFINYVRTNVKPTLSEASKNVITKFCLLRRLKESDSTEFEKCVRTLVNLTKARARIDLRIETSEQDVFDAIEILENSMSIDTKDLAENQPQSSCNNANKITANKVKQFVNDLRSEALQEEKNVFSEAELRNIAGQENLSTRAFSELLGKLNEQGYLLKLSSKSYKVVFL